MMSSNLLMLLSLIMDLLSAVFGMDVILFPQLVPAASALPVLTMASVTTVTLETAPVPAMQDLGAWPVGSAEMDSMDLPVQVSRRQTLVLCRL